ncbi:MAG TPA: hypothetical protein VNJ02_18600 [Vicinamibacterales bacterium]|nr:hypothetical protein [Vicinamibacterales bacterium]
MPELNVIRTASRAPFVCVSLTVVAVLFGDGATLNAQAWVPAKGEGTVTVTYQNVYNKGHFDRQGRETPNGATHSKSVLTDLTYGVTDTTALTVSLPFVAAKYTGPRPSYFVGGIETFPGPLDDGVYHGAFQDLRLEVRHAFVAGPLTVTPLVAVALPTHAYETVGEAVPGRHRRELQLGANAGVLLDRIARGAYVHARYTYTTARRLQDLPYRLSNIDLEGGHALTSRVALRGLASWQMAHEAPTIAQLAPSWRVHDRFVVPNYLHLGAGASVALTHSTEIHALWVSAVSGRGGAHIARTFAVGTSWSFGGGLSGLTASAPSAERTGGTMGVRSASFPSNGPVVEYGR